jgi:Pectate lyase superfamily protein
MTVANVREYGAVGDGVTDDHAAVTAAITAADGAGGGTVFFPSGVYAVSAPLGIADPGISRVCLLGDGDRASTILATGNFAPVTGAWTQSRIENMMIDAGGHGGPGMMVDLDKSYVRHCWVRNWSGHGISLNPTRVGLLNWVDDTFVEQCDGTGVHTTYRFYDSGIVNNNIGSTGPNLSVESGPVRILANHLNGSPRFNIELRGNKSLTIIGNICEGARREAIVYTMPSWLGTDSPQVQIVGNNITNGGKESPGEYPAIGVYSRDAAHRTSGFNITGNYFACTDDDAGWAYAVVADDVDTVAITGNQWDNRGFTVAPVKVSGTNISVAGNTSGNDGRVVATLDAPTRLTATSGDHVYFLSDGAAITLPAAAANTCRYTVTNLCASGCRIAAPSGDSINRSTAISLAPGESVEILSDGTNWWTV